MGDRWHGMAWHGILAHWHMGGWGKRKWEMRENGTPTDVPKPAPPCRPDSLLGRLVQPHTRASASHAETGNTRHTRTGEGRGPN